MGDTFTWDIGDKRVNALEIDIEGGGAQALCETIAGSPYTDGRSVSGVSCEPQDGIQVEATVPGGRQTWSAGPVAVSEAIAAANDGAVAAGDSTGETASPAVGSPEDMGLPAQAVPGTKDSGGADHHAVAGTVGADPAATSTATPWTTGVAAAPDGTGKVQSGLDRGLQGVVSDGGPGLYRP